MRFARRRPAKGEKCHRREFSLQLNTHKLQVLAYAPLAFADYEINPQKGKALIIVAVTTLIIGFFMMDFYVPNNGLVWNAMHGDIQLFQSDDRWACRGAEIAEKSWHDRVSKCGVSIPYGWLMFLCVIAIAFGVWTLWKIDNPSKQFFREQYGCGNSAPIC